MRHDAVDSLRSYLEAAATGDAERLPPFYAAPTAYWPRGRQLLLRTSDEILEFEASFVSAYTDLFITIHQIRGNETEALAHCTMGAVHTGSYPAPDGTVIPATNRPFQVDTVDIVRTGADGLFVEHLRVFNPLDVAAQLRA